MNRHGWMQGDSEMMETKRNPCESCQQQRVKGKEKEDFCLICYNRGIVFKGKHLGLTETLLLITHEISFLYTRFCLFKIEKYDLK